MQELPGGTPGQTSGTGQSYEDQAQRPGRPPRRPDRDDDDGPGRPPEQGPNDLRCRCRARVRCRCDDDCGLPGEVLQGSIRYLLQELEAELAKPPRYPGSPADARGDFDKALQEGEKEYQGIDAVVKKYRDFHCQIDCDLERARTWCDDLRGWCQVDPQVGRRIARLWRKAYERREERLRDEWEESAQALAGTRDCVEQAAQRVDEARRAYDAVKEWEKTLKDRFAELKTLYDRAKGHLDAKEYKSVCAILLEYRKVYERLDELPFSVGGGDEGENEHGRGGGGGGGGDDLPGRCNPPDERVKRLNAAWLRGQLIQALRELLVARYCRFCWHQQRIDLTTDRDRDRAALDAFLKRRRDEFVMEARDVEGDDEEGGSAAAGGRQAGRGSYESRPQAGDDEEGGSAAAGGRQAGRGSYESRPQAGDDDQNQP